MLFTQRTDLALEAGELAGELEGVISGVSGNVHIIEITTEAASEKLGKPMGSYYTIELNALLRREDKAFETVARQLSRVIADETPKSGTILVVGLGNRYITPDALGVITAENLLVTRHLKNQMPHDFSGFRSVAVTTPGVLGTSGIESAAHIKALCRLLQPGAVIAVDALAARRPERLCRTVQITDTGITPGSGVGNSREELSSASLGVPVIAIGVPTVVDISTLLSDLGAEPHQDDGLIVTPRSIDSEVACAGRLLGYAINIALHKGITLEDIDMLLG